MTENYLKHIYDKPEISSEAFIAHNAAVVGNAVIDSKSSVWFGAVVRADNARCHLGEGSNLQDCAVIHCETDHPTEIGRHVTIGHGAIVHGAEIGENTLIGMGAIIMNGAVIGKNCIIGAGAIVTEGTVIPDGSVAMGTPAKIKRQITDSEIEDNLNAALEYIEASRIFMSGRAGMA